MNLRDLWTNLDDASRQAFFRTALWITLIVGTVYTIGQSDLLQDYAPLAVRIEMPEKILFPKSNKTVTLPVNLQLKNNTEETAHLQVESPCNIIRWYITSKDGNFVQAPAKETCSQMVMRASLPAGQYSQDELLISLDVTRYQAGIGYRLVTSYWGQEASRDFEVELE